MVWLFDGIGDMLRVASVIVSFRPTVLFSFNLIKSEGFFKAYLDLKD